MHWSYGTAAFHYDRTSCVMLVREFLWGWGVGLMGAGGCASHDPKEFGPMINMTCRFRGCYWDEYPGALFMSSHYNSFEEWIFMHMGLNTSNELQ